MRHLKYKKDLFSKPAEGEKYLLKKLVLENDVCPYNEWFETLSEDDQIMVIDRMARVRQGSFGEINVLEEGVWEFKFRKGRALRIYYGQIGKVVLLLLVGGDKRTQKRDIKKAIEFFSNFKDGIGSDEDA
jgi:putative addiction module killer protein